MRIKLAPYGLAATFAFSLALPLNSAAQELQQIVEEQQIQLDSQQKQLNELKQNLMEVQSNEQLSADETATVVADEAFAFSRRMDFQTQRRDKKQPHHQWEGSFPIEGTDTRIKIGGFVELDILHDTDAIGTKGQFVTATIATRNKQKAEGADGQTSFSVNPTRLYVESRTPFENHQVTTFISMDMFADSAGLSPEPRLRQAYVEIGRILFGGDLLIGQAWSTYTDLEGTPEVLDYQMPNSVIGLRQPQVRWTKALADGFKLKLALETPNNHIIDGADSLTGWPDGIAAMTWDKPSAFHLMGKMVARDLRTSELNGPTYNTLGWGAGISGKVILPYAAKKDALTFSLSYGQGMGSCFNDQPPDAVIDGDSLEAIPAFGWLVGYQHAWTDALSSTFSYGNLKVDNRETQSAESFKRTQYASGNLAWNINSHWLLGIEQLWGSREDKDGAYGSVYRTLLVSRFTF